MIDDLLQGIENRLDTIEELIDNIEDNDVNVKSFRDCISKVWDELNTLREKNC